MYRYTGGSILTGLIFTRLEIHKDRICEAVRLLTQTEFRVIHLREPGPVKPSKTQVQTSEPLPQKIQPGRTSRTVIRAKPDS